MEEEKIIKYHCEFCKDTGIITKTEWDFINDKDVDYEVEIKCQCTDE